MSRISKRSAITSDHITWPVLNQFATKGIIALKFLIAAKILGPQYMGIVGTILIIYAISEAISEFGLIPALVQSEKEPTTLELDSAWWALFYRGIALCLFLVTFSFFLDFKELQSDFRSSCFLIALCALMKSSSSVELYLRQRQRDFYNLFRISIIGVSFDLAITLYLLLNYPSITSIFIGLALNELIKFLMSYYFFEASLRHYHSPKLSLKSFGNFGKWIWFSNLLNITLNQTDKIVTGMLLGINQLGIYQLSSRLAQFGIADISLGISHYLFPSFSRLNAADKLARDLLLVKAFVCMFAFSSSIVICVYFLAEFIPLLLGEEWTNSVNILRILAFSMLNGSLISVLVSYHRARGNPKVVTVSSVIQLVIFLPTLYFFTIFFGALGAAFSTFIGTLSCLIILALKVKISYLALKHLNTKLILNLISFVLIIFTVSIAVNKNTAIILCIFGTLWLWYSIYLYARNNKK